MPRKLAVRRLRISDRTAQKILTKHQLHADEVRATIEGEEGLDFSWDRHPTRGRRAILRVEIREQPCLVVLYPSEGEYGETWDLGSAYPDDQDD